MSSDKADCALLRFSTNDLPEHGRLPFWREVFTRDKIHVEIEAVARLPFASAATLLAWSGLRVIWAGHSPVRIVRNPPPVIEAPGVLYAESTIMQLARSDWVALSIPNVALTTFVTGLEFGAMRLVPRDSELLRFLTRYLEILKEDPDLVASDLRHASLTHIQDLVAMTLSASYQSAAAAERGTRAMRLTAIVADVLTNLSDPELTVTAVALRQGVTPRYIHLLLEGDGTTFSEFVLNARLVHAYRMLTSARFDKSTITNIAFTCGFSDLSYFDRTFRRRFGVTPSNVRKGISPAS